MPARSAPTWPRTDYRAVTENPEIDIVHICTPNHLHREALLSAMRQQKHIYCDKPLVATLAEAEEIEAALPDYRGTAQMTFQNRFFPATLRANNSSRPARWARCSSSARTTCTAAAPIPTRR